MNAEEIRTFCLCFPSATEKLQWGDALCFKVGGKMFAVLGLDDLRFTVKCTPETFAELIERDGIVPAPYVGRYKWVMLHRLDVLRREELEELIRISYEMVSMGAPMKKAIGSKRTGTARRSKKSASDNRRAKR